MQRISVLLAEDHQVVREGLRALLEMQPDIEVVGEAGDGRQAVELASTRGPQVVVMDIRMPKLDGVQATRRIVKLAPGTKVLALSSFDDLEEVMKMVRAGASGFLTKRSASNQLADAIRRVQSGKTIYSPEIAKLMPESNAVFLESKGPGIPERRISERQVQVLKLLAQGLPNKAIAADLGISIKTVANHRQAIMNKLDVHDIAGLTRYAVSKGLLQIVT